MSESFAAGLVGVVLDGRYRLDALLGEGGMGAVYRAHHLAMDRRVAVKLLKPHLTGDDAALQRFAREARATLRVDSPHAVKVLDFGVTPHRDYYMVLEFLDGRTVQRELDVDGPFAPARVLHIAKQALHALGAAHASGLVHRDIKPDNILLMRTGDDPDDTKVLDFGVAKLMDGAARSAHSALAITQAGMVFGTPEFMSPEQACGQALDPRSDLYSLAATMYAMLTGLGMYPANSQIEWLTHHARTPPPHLADGLASLAAFPELDGLLQRCLAKRRDDRPASAAEMAGLIAALEATLGAPVTPVTPDMPDRPSKSAGFSPSSYIAALADGAPLPTTTGAVAELAGRRRGTWLAVGAVVICGMIVAAVIVATRGGKPAGANQPSSRAPVAAKPAIAGVDADAGAVVVGDAASATPDAGVVHLASGPRPSGDAARHVAAAEDARRAQNRLGQLAEADAALRIDPRNVRARLLAAEAMLASGDTDHGCKYLRMLGRIPTALAMARQAGCPTD